MDLCEDNNWKKRKTGPANDDQIRRKLAQATEEKVELFAECFKDKIVKTIEETKLKDTFDGYKLIDKEENMTTEIFTFDKLSQIVNKLPNKTCFGHDRVPMRTIKDAWPLIGRTVCELFNKIEKEGTAPEQWRVGRMTPLFKRARRGLRKL